MVNGRKWPGAVLGPALAIAAIGKSAVSPTAAMWSSLPQAAPGQNLPPGSLLYS